jgi:hypothetical protein
LAALETCPLERFGFRDHVAQAAMPERDAPPAPALWPQPSGGASLAARVRATARITSGL